MFVHNIPERGYIMNRNRLIIISITAVLCISFGIVGYYTALNRVKHNYSLYENNNITEETNNEDARVSSTDNKINPSTKMVYQYYYADEGTTKVSEDVPPYFMLGLTLDDMVKYYTNWDIVSFSPQEVVMRKTVYGDDSQSYFVCEKDGYITVYYEENGEKSSIKEITSIDTNGLSDEEKERLKKGFSVVGDYSLNRVLENYSS